MIKVYCVLNKKKRTREYKIEIPIDDFTDALMSFTPLEREVIDGSLKPMTAHNAVAALALIVERSNELALKKSKKAKGDKNEGK